MREENEFMKRELQLLERKLDEMKEYIKEEIGKVMAGGSREEIVVEVRKQVMAELQEIEDKKARKPNLVIYGAVESQSQDPKEREKFDKELSSKIIKEGLEIKDVKIEKAIRLGKRSETQNAENEDPDQEENDNISAQFAPFYIPPLFSVVSFPI